MRNKSSHTRTRRATPWCAFLVSLSFGLTACTSTPSVTQEPNSGNTEIAPLLSKVVLRRDTLPAMKPLKLGLKGSTWTLDKSPAITTLPSAKKVVRLKHTKAKGFQIAEVKTKLKAARQLSLRHAPIRKFTSPMVLTGTQIKGGKFEFNIGTYKQVTTAFGDCDAFEVYNDGSTVYATLPTAPIHVTVTSTSATYKREGSDKSSTVPLTPGKKRWYMGPCLDPDGVSRVLMMDGGLTAIDFVDNIIDPNALSGSAGTDPFLAEFNLQLQAGIREMAASQKDYPCDELSSRTWPSKPVACFPLAGTTVTIYCNRELVVVSGQSVIRIDLITCGGSLEVVGDKLAVYDGCGDGTVSCK